MTQIANEELVRKALIIAADLANNGKLNPAQSDRFIDFVIDETKMSGNARIVRFRNETLEIDKIGVGERVAVPKSEAVDPGVRRGIETSKVTLKPSEVMTPFEIGDNFRELNIEGDNVEDHIVQMMAKQMANDLEEMYITGNKLGPAALESKLLGGGSETQFVKDTFLALQDGWQLLADGGNIVDAEGQNIGLSIFDKAIRAMPTKFRRNMADLRWFLSPDLMQLYRAKLTTRATGLGDAAAGGANQSPFGIPAIEIPIWDFQPTVVEHVQLNGTTPVALKNAPISGEVVLPEDLNKTATTPFVGGGTDYVVDLALGTIARDAGGAIGDGDTVKVTYQSNPQLILTHMNNFVIGIGRDVRIERDREIFKSVNQFAITMKTAVEFEELSAIVKVRNIGTGV